MQMYIIHFVVLLTRGWDGRDGVIHFKDYMCEDERSILGCN